MPFRWVDSFRYLGVNIHRTNNLSKGLKLICHQAKKAQSTLDMHISSHSTVSLNHNFELFDCLIKPVLTSECAVWGSGKIVEIEKCHLPVYETSIKCQDDYKLLCSICGDREVPSLCFH